MILCVLSKAIMGYRTCTSNGMRRKDHQLKTCLKSNSCKYLSCVQSAVTATRDPIDISQFARRAHFARASGTETQISGFTVNISTWKFCSYEITIQIFYSFQNDVGKSVLTQCLQIPRSAGPYWHRTLQGRSNIVL